MDDWANALGTNNSPNEEGQSCCGHKIGFDCEKMTDLLDWKPNSWKGSDREEEEGNKSDSVGA